MAQLQPIICPLSERPKSFRKDGYKLIDGKWIGNIPIWNTGSVESHTSKTLKGKGRYYV
jgi:hypothetical protein